MQVEAFELREAIEEVRARGDITDALETEKQIASRIKRAGDNMELSLKIDDFENMKKSAARIIYLCKVILPFSIFPRHISDFFSFIYYFG